MQTVSKIIIIILLQDAHTVLPRSTLQQDILGGHPHCAVSTLWRDIIAIYSENSEILCMIFKGPVKINQLSLVFDIPCHGLRDVYIPYDHASYYSDGQ